MACCDKAIEVDPGRAEPWCAKGAALDALGRYQEELTCYDKAIELDPRCGPAWLNRFLTLCRLGRYGEAEDALRQAVKLGDPGVQRALEVLQQRMARQSGQGG